MRTAAEKKNAEAVQKQKDILSAGPVLPAEYIKREGLDAFGKFKEKLVREFNSLGLKDLKVNDLNLLNGFYVNLEYHLPNGSP